MSKISDFVTSALDANNKDVHAEISLGFIGNQHGQKIAEQTGTKTLSGAEKIITADGVRHAFVRHASKKLEQERGQDGITVEDFEYLSDIISNPTNVERGDNQNRKRNDVIKFSKNIKGRTYNVLMSITVSNGKTTLTFNTMFIKK